MNGLLKQLAGSLYGGSHWLNQPGELPPPLRGRGFRFYSYGRHALLEALTLAGVGEGDAVLVPEYICREMLAPIHALGARVEYYPVGRELALSVPADGLPETRAVLAINYFGFPQDLSQLEAYCRKTGAILIEDNAHGFLSRDQDGMFLGTRGDIGVFSFRKSIPLVNGSGVIVNHPEKIRQLPPQLPYMSYPVPRAFQTKKFLRRLPRWNMTGLLYAVISLDRALRRLRTGSDCVKSGDTAETALPGGSAPDLNLLSALKLLDVDYEISRRRMMYTGIEKFVRGNGGIPVFRRLPENVAPYGFPFRAAPESLKKVRQVLKKNYLDCYLWPELPSAIEQKASEDYKNVWLVNFIW